MDIATLLRQANITVWTSIKDMPTQARNEYSFNALECVDAIVLEIGHSVPELQFILAQAIVLRRPTLCLYTKNNEPREILNHLTGHHVPKTITLKPYTRANLDDIVNKFLKTIDQSVQLQDTHNIKFTVRLTEGLEHYLEWVASQKQINKADYLRQLLREDSERNENYQQIIHWWWWMRSWRKLSVC